MSSTSRRADSFGSPSAQQDQRAEQHHESIARQGQRRTDGHRQHTGWTQHGLIGNGDWLQYNNVNFGSTPVEEFIARVASGAGWA